MTGIRTAMNTNPDRSHLDPAAVEAAALRFSMAGYLCMAALGVGFAWLTRSDAILLDGVYSLVSFVMAFLAGKVSRLVDRPGSETFHFGFAHFEPWLNAVRGLLILILCSFALFSAVDALLHGGRPLSAGYAMIYGAGAALIGVLVALRQKRAAKRAASPILEVDARNWLMDGIISLGVGLSFLVAFLLRYTPYGHWMPYVDPLLVSILVVVMIRVPITTVWENFLEIIQVAPERDDQEMVEERVNATLGDLPRRKTVVRMMKVGRYFYVMVHVILEPDYAVGRVTDLDAVRTRVAGSLKDIPHRLVVDTVFTADERWVTGGHVGEATRG